MLHKEAPGFVANCRQSAQFLECVHPVAEGVVTDAWLDDIVTSSIGLRWAAAGPFRIFHPGGGPSGLPIFLEHLGRTMDPSFDDPTGLPPHRAGPRSIQGP
ncbi:hypothetical protein ACFYXC_40500 [Streptomyces sp. NPDC002701]|uniref:hypothetical protein n=1 Tax=Streptomyces sp. NPDC002701 TaxID=3364661 RepID=UPI0036A952CA